MKTQLMPLMPAEELSKIIETFVAAIKCRNEIIALSDAEIKKLKEEIKYRDIIINDIVGVNDNIAMRDAEIKRLEAMQKSNKEEEELLYEELIYLPLYIVLTPVFWSFFFSGGWLVFCAVVLYNFHKFNKILWKKRNTSIKQKNKTKREEGKKEYAQQSYKIFLYGQDEKCKKTQDSDKKSEEDKFNELLEFLIQENENEVVVHKDRT